MPGRAPKPPDQRRTRHKPQRGEFVAKDVVGWQHGPIPEPPDGLVAESRQTWELWFHAWFAAHWLPEDVPVIRQTIRLFDEVERGSTKKAQDRAQLHIWMRGYGITPDGQLANRWARPKPIEETKPSSSPSQPSAASHYGHLKVVNE